MEEGFTHYKVLLRILSEDCREENEAKSVGTPNCNFITVSAKPLCILFTKTIRAHSTHNSTLSFPPTCFGDHIAIISEFNTLIYLKHFKIWHSYIHNVPFYHSDNRVKVYMMSDTVKPSKTVQAYLNVCLL